ncbi:MAG: hypothetical protein AAFV71_28525 [Cyanobacteria bacterium J06633_8]
MDSNPIKDLEIIAHVLTIAKTHEITTKEALNLYINQLELEVEQKKVQKTNLSSTLKERLSPDKWELLMSYVRNYQSSEELKSNYYKAKQDGKLKLVKLLVGGDFYIRNSDFLGNKYLSPGTILEAEVYDNVICQVWLSPTECEFVFINELEFI